MDFDLTPEQEDFRAVVRTFARDVIAPRAEGFNRSEEFPVDIVLEMGRLGLFGLRSRRSTGGRGRTS